MRLKSLPSNDVPDGVKMIARDGPAPRISINVANADGTGDVTVETILVHLRGDAR